MDVIKTIRTLAVLLIIPVVTFAIAKGFELGYEGEEQAMILLQKTAIIAGVLPIIMMFFIALAGRISRNNRNVLLKTFGPGLHLTIYGLVGLIIIDATILIVAIYLIETTLFGRPHVFLIGAIAAGTMVGAASMITNSLNALKINEIDAPGKILEESEHPRLFDFINNTARELNTSPPQHILVGIFPSFFVTEMDVKCQNQNLSGKTLYLSLSLCRIMEKEEIKSIIGHELAHYKGEDTVFSKKFDPIYRRATGAIYGLASTTGYTANEDEDYGSWALIPARYILAHFLDSFSVADSTIRRERELAADKEGSNITNQISTASALVKSSLFSSLWEDVEEEVFNTIREGKPIENVSVLFKELVTKHAVPESLEGLVDQEMMHPTDSHPTLSLRLESLGMDISSVEDIALDINPPEVAIELFESYQEIEKELSEYYQVTT